MSWLSETFFFVKTLFTEKPKSRDKLTMKCMEHYPFKGYKYMMWCGYVIYRKDNEDNIKKEKRTFKWKRDMRHETIHLMQAKDCSKTTFFSYYFQYLWQWIIGNPFLKDNIAYYTSPFEMEAYACEDETYYVEGREIEEHKFYYIIPNKRKEYFNKAGGTVSEWKNALKAGVWYDEKMRDL